MQRQPCGQTTLQSELPDEIRKGIPTPESQVGG